MGRAWGTTLVDRPRSAATQVRLPTKNGAEAASYDFPLSDDEERVLMPVHRTSGKSKLTKDAFDFPPSDIDEVQKPNILIKRKRSASLAKMEQESTAALQKASLVTNGSITPKMKQASKISETINVTKATPSKAQAASKAVPPLRIRDTSASLQPSASKRPKVVNQDVFDFPDSDGENAARKLKPKVSGSRRARSKTPATSITRPTAIAIVKRHRAASPLESQISKRAALEKSFSVSEKQQPITAKQSKTKESRVTKPRATSRTRATKSPAESIVSKRSHARTPSALRAAAPKSSSAPEALTGLSSQPRTRDQTPFSLASPTSIKSPNLRTPSPSAPASPKTIVRAQTMTPRQTDLWNKLIDEDDDDMDGISVSRLQLNSVSRAVPRLSSAPTLNTRMRLVDHLKASQVIDEEEESEFEEEESDQSGDDTMQVDGISNSQVTQTVSQVSTTTRATYGHMRSHVEVKDENDMFELLIDDIHVPTTNRKSQIIFDEGLESSEDETSQPRNIHDLKAAGSKRRRQAELEHLIDGIQSDGLGSLSAQRSDLLELTKKLMNSSNLDILLDHGLERPLLTSLSKSNDLVMHFMGSICLMIIIEKSQNIVVFQTIQKSDFYDILMELLSNDLGISRIMKNRKTNMSRVMQITVSEFLDELRNANFWQIRDDALLTPKLLGLVTADMLIRKMRELGNDEILLDDRSIVRLLAILEHGPDTVNGKQETELVFSILESSSIGMSINGRRIWPTSAIKKLASHASEFISLSSDKETHSPTRLLALRLSLNLTNNDARACDIFAASDFIIGLLQRINQDFNRLSTSLINASATMDELILSLGAMINMAELSDAARSQVLSDGGITLETSIDIFSSKQDSILETESVEASTLNVPYGYLALLLVNLCQNVTVRTQILKHLPAGQLDALVFAAEEFIRINQQTDRELLAGDGGGEIYQSYTKRLMGMVKKLKDLASS